MTKSTLPLRNEPPSDALAPGQKCLVLGSTGYHGVDSVAWRDDLPNIVDYDVVIIDVRTLDEKTLLTLNEDSFKTLRIELIRLLHSHGRIIALSDRKISVNQSETHRRWVSNYSWCPVSINTSDESGDSLKVLEPRFLTFTNHLTKWPYYYSAPFDGLSREGFDFYGGIQIEYSIVSRPFIENRYGRTVSGSLSITIKDRLKRSDTPDHVTGEIILPRWCIEALCLSTPSPTRSSQWTPPTGTSCGGMRTSPMPG